MLEAGLPPIDHTFPNLWHASFPALVQLAHHLSDGNKVWKMAFVQSFEIPEILARKGFREDWNDQSTRRSTAALSKSSRKLALSAEREQSLEDFAMRPS